MIMAIKWTSMKVTISFRQATVADLGFLLALRIASMSEHLVRAGIRLSHEENLERVKEHFSDSQIILRDKQPVGLIKIGFLSSSLHIRQFQIMPDFHRLGIGTYVMGVVKKKALKFGLPITLNVLINNPAKSLYLRHGFFVKYKNSLEYQMQWDG